MNAVGDHGWQFDSLGGDNLAKLLTSKARKRSRAREKEPARRLCCASCGHEITGWRSQVSVDGSHQHRFVNPLGLEYNIACYAEAPGCFQVGEPTDEHTWFPGHAWRVALCGSCQIHLGWGFQSRDGGQFFGLILDRLTSLDESGQ